MKLQEVKVHLHEIEGCHMSKYTLTRSKVCEIGRTLW